ncbi:hypothetical protein L599_000200000900 [Luteimonas sp. J16]|jgi:hypothetical protein|uniref:hypothetical protein n=1 Tax=unclassified Luteimonas TaxID=2629088 RepID=UPI00047B7216|nr:MULTISPECIES: hypothetical protein [unclassified Luteimonas]TWG92218.1 hypothetical protein L599_000200000900 [Luteimonas sp. J16]
MNKYAHIAEMIAAGSPSDAQCFMPDEDDISESAEAVRRLAAYAKLAVSDPDVPPIDDDEARRLEVLSITSPSMRSWLRVLHELLRIQGSPTSPQDGP